MLGFLVALAPVSCGGGGPVPASKISATFVGNAGTLIHHGQRVRMRGATVGHVTFQKVIKSPVSEDGSRVGIQLNPGAPAIGPDAVPVVGASTWMRIMRGSRLEQIKAKPGPDELLPGNFNR
jgi:ABC-type transporter Mla subunit MlaD